MSRYLLLFAAVLLPTFAQDTKELAAIRYADLQTGTGAPAESGKRFTVHYTGWLKDGTKFDSSRDRNEPFTFVQGRRQVITGWDIGFEGMRVGGKRRLIIPYQFAYGEKGTGPIPANAELTFEVELLGVADAPALAPAIDLLLPYRELEERALKLQKLKSAAIASKLQQIANLNALYLEAANADSPSVANETASSGAVPDLAQSFAGVRKELEQARNGYLSSDARWMGQDTTRRGLFTALISRVAAMLGAAEMAAEKN